MSCLSQNDSVAASDIILSIMVHCMEYHGFTSDRFISIKFKLFSPTSTINGCLEDQLGSKRNSYYLSLISHLTFLNAAREVDRIQNNNTKDQLHIPTIES
uniref:Uncharacterized protein n=1 Tax=Strongyloides stercoralis TaxID=6248 RepID=A0AAF5CT09_STRER